MTPSAEEAREAVERVRSGIAALEFEGDLAGVRITASAGLAMSGGGESFEEVLVRADRALYAAKAAVRNQLVVA